MLQKEPAPVPDLTVKGFGMVNKAEIDVFLELSCFFHDPVDVGNLISGSSAFHGHSKQYEVIPCYNFDLHFSNN